MKKYAGIAVILLVFTSAYAVDEPDMSQEAAQYDWQSCLTARESSCLNGCATSSDINCNETCTETARAKCTEEGFSPPPY